MGAGKSNLLLLGAVFEIWQYCGVAVLAENFLGKIWKQKSIFVGDGSHWRLGFPGKISHMFYRAEYPAPRTKYVADSAGFIPAMQHAVLALRTSPIMS